MLNHLWRQVFIGYYAKPAQVEQWFAAAESGPKAGAVGPKADYDGSMTGELSVAPSAIPAAIATATALLAARKLHQVVYFREKQQYVDALKGAQPQIDMSIGFYCDNARTAYFYASDS